MSVGLVARISEVAAEAPVVAVVMGTAAEACRARVGAGFSWGRLTLGGSMLALASAGSELALAAFFSWESCSVKTGQGEMYMRIS